MIQIWYSDLLIGNPRSDLLSVDPQRLVEVKYHKQYLAVFAESNILGKNYIGKDFYISLVCIVWSLLFR